MAASWGELPGSIPIPFPSAGTAVSAPRAEDGPYLLEGICCRKFSEEIFNNEKLALLSVLLLEGIYFYNFTSTTSFSKNFHELASPENDVTHVRQHSD